MGDHDLQYGTKNTDTTKDGVTLGGKKKTPYSVFIVLGVGISVLILAVITHFVK